MKRYIYIILGIIVLAAIAIAIIFYLKNPSSSSSLFGFGSGGSLPQTGTQGTSTGQQGGSNNNQVGNSTNNTSSSVAGAGGLVQTFGIVADGPILDYFVDAQNNITAIKPDGTIISISGENSSTLSATTVPGIITARFSSDGKKVLVSSGDPSTPKTNIFDVATKVWVSAPQGLQSPQWSPSGYQIAYLSQSASGMLSLSTIDALNLKKAPATLLSIHATDLVLQWINKNQFVLSDRPSANNAGSIWLFDAQKSTMTPIVYENSGAESMWNNATTGTLGLVFDNGGRNSTLQLVTPLGTIYHALSFLTLPSKCSFSIATTTIAAATTTTSTTKSSKPTTSSVSYLYCGVPLDINAFSSAQLSDNYNMMASFTSDQILRINVADGSWNILWNDPTQNIDATDLRFFNNTLFFVNRYDQKLYALTLVTPSSTTQ
jgi:hypothetical protein